MQLIVELAAAQLDEKGFLPFAHVWHEQRVVVMCFQRSLIVLVPYTELLAVHLHCMCLSLL